MILTLTKPYNPGDADPGKNYTHLHIEQLSYNSSTFAVQFGYAYGELDGDKKFIPGKVPGLQSIVAVGDDLTAIQGEMTKQGEPALPACFRLGYSFIQKKLGIEGTLDYDLPASDVAPKAEETPSA